MHCGDCRCAERLGFVSPAGTDVRMEKKIATTFPYIGADTHTHTHTHKHTNLFRVGSEAWVELSVFKTPRNQQNEQKKPENI